MSRIAVTDGINSRAISKLERAGHEVIVSDFSLEELHAGVLSGFKAVIIRSATVLTAEIIESSSGLEIIARAGVGVDNIDLQAAHKKGIVVLNAPNAGTQSVVELTIGHLLGSIRFLPRADRSLRLGKWEKNNLVGTELSGKCLGLIGFGRIAQGVAKIATLFGMKIHAYDPYLPPRIARQQGVTMHKKIDTLFETCTHISVHCNLNEETYHLVNFERMSKMPSRSPDGLLCGNHIVNCARGGIVCEDDLFRALSEGVLSSAALDVFESEPVSQKHPLFSCDNFHATPHIGAATLEAQTRVGLDIAQGVIDVLAGNEPQFVVR